MGPKRMSPAPCAPASLSGNKVQIARSRGVDRRASLQYNVIDASVARHSDRLSAGQPKTGPELEPALAPDQHQNVSRPVASTDIHPVHGGPMAPELQVRFPGRPSFPFREAPERAARELPPQTHLVSSAPPLSPVVCRHRPRRCDARAGVCRTPNPAVSAPRPVLACYGGDCPFADSRRALCRTLHSLHQLAFFNSSATH